MSARGFYEPPKPGLSLELRAAQIADAGTAAFAASLAEGKASAGRDRRKATFDAALYHLREATGQDGSTATGQADDQHNSPEG